MISLDVMITISFWEIYCYNFRNTYLLQDDKLLFYWTCEFGLGKNVKNNIFKNIKTAFVIEH